MKQIWKYPLPVQGYAEVSMPPGAEVFSVAAQMQTPTVWAIVDAPGEFSRLPVEKPPRRFYCAFTGFDLPEEVLGWKRHGTVLLAGDRLVVHVFEEPHA